MEGQHERAHFEESSTRTPTFSFFLLCEILVSSSQPSVQAPLMASRPLPCTPDEFSVILGVQGTLEDFSAKWEVVVDSVTEEPPLPEDFQLLTSMFSEIFLSGRFYRIEVIQNLEDFSYCLKQRNFKRLVSTSKSRVPLHLACELALSGGCVVSSEGMMMFSRCKAVKVSHQKKAWPAHKKMCFKPNW
ncbi:hypothetical protein BDY24DRAFT_410992 [Mrakia frigida]|uniref:zinc finger MYND domain-containing protein n=1 Tax=Mrakia frigida TaxID=29902 RepID=UPI003FCC04BE